MPPTKQYFDAITLSRGAAAFLVVLFHAWIWILWPTEELSVFQGKLGYVLGERSLFESAASLTLGLGFIGVPIFFVLSGFCIHIGSARLEKLDLKAFFVRRFFRLYPLYFIVVVGLFLLHLVLGQGIEKGVTWTNFISHLCFWHFAGPESSGGLGISVVLWTIALEAVFYVMYAVLFPLLRRVSIYRITIVWCLVNLAYRVFWEMGGEGMGWHLIFQPERFPVIRFGEWLLGACVAESLVRGGGWQSMIDRAAWKNVLAAVLCLVGGVLIGGLLVISKENAMDLSVAVGFTFLLFAMLRSDSGVRLPGWLNKVGHYLGDRCYSIYLTHATMLWLIASSIRLSLGDGWAEGGWQTVLLAGFAIFGALVCAEPVYRWLEVPTHRLGRYVAKKLSAAPSSPAPTPKPEPMEVQ